MALLPMRALSIRLLAQAAQELLSSLVRPSPRNREVVGPWAHQDIDACWVYIYEREKRPKQKHTIHLRDLWFSWYGRQ